MICRKLLEIKPDPVGELLRSATRRWRGEDERRDTRKRSLLAGPISRVGM